MMQLLRSIKVIILRKLDLFRYIPELFSRKGHLYVSYAIPPGHTYNYNWGDDVNKALVELISGKKVIPYHCAWFPQTNFCCIGSILQWYVNKRTVVWGTGLREIKNIILPQSILAVRGPLTRQELLKQGISCPEIYGDPALLFPIYYQPNVSKKYKVGIICHFTELNQLKDKYLLDDCHYHFINIRQYGYWQNFINEVCMCETILSSSLHGCIIADAYRVPNLWCQFTDYIAEEKGFKFRDYYLSTKRSISQPMKIEELQDSHKITIAHWRPPEIDLNLLMSVCPFKKKI